MTEAALTQPIRIGVDSFLRRGLTSTLQFGSKVADIGGQTLVASERRDNLSNPSVALLKEFLEDRCKNGLDLPLELYNVDLSKDEKTVEVVLKRPGKFDVLAFKVTLEGRYATVTQGIGTQSENQPVKLTKSTSNLSQKNMSIDAAFQLFKQFLNSHDETIAKWDAEAIQGKAESLGSGQFVPTDLAKRVLFAQPDAFQYEGWDRASLAELVESPGEVFISRDGNPHTFYLALKAAAK